LKEFFLGVAGYWWPALFFRLSSSIFPDDASAGAGSVYLADPVKLEELLAG